MPSNQIAQSTVAPELTEVIQQLRDLTHQYLTALGGAGVARKEMDINELYPSDDDDDIVKPKTTQKPSPKKNLEGIRIDILNNLMKILDSKDPQVLPIEKINQFYNYLSKDPDLIPEDPKISLQTNLDVIKIDKSKSAARFLAGIALIALTVLTLVVPGLIVMGIVYGVTHRHVFDLFKPKSESFEKNVELLKPNDLKFFKEVPIGDDKPLPMIQPGIPG